ncbi:hypothetical protein SAMN05421595_1457 [Austwickia chelonae]|uniref:Uncharacterized protein n=1 Tax=Austwickia chelonae NBRC 105200 TaxID=1184607 RepID=K6VLM0_9MICO|nr:Rv2175c family DNA-binding protein [Austwickia chelonae]GAB77619.1 hypothetical protein AUCHE_05_05340 [Austwickia chelonae NBRC 105200]SEW14255.1 hypothetical protein SAMN05421595_1457 [Austwickia chelonae]
MLADVSKKSASTPDTSTEPTRREQRAALDGERLAALEELVPGWLSVPEVAELQGVSLSTVRHQLQERELLGVRRGDNKAVYVPESFVTAEGPRPELRGTFTVLSDGGMDDIELLSWMFRPDDSFTGGSPMGCLLAGHKTEVRRRAMEEAF